MNAEKKNPESRQKKAYIDRLFFSGAIAFLLFVFFVQINRDSTIEPAPSSVPPASDSTSLPAPVLTHQDVLVTPQVTENSRYPQPAMDYFAEIAFQSEHQALEPRIRKWTDDISVRIEGNPTSEDLLALKQTLEEINSLQSAIHMEIGYFETDLIIYFQPESTFKSINANYQGYNLGYFRVRWIEDEIYAAQVFIDTQTTNQQDRNGLIKEEIVQSLGLMNTSDRYKDSIFNDEQDHYVSKLSNLDRMLVRMLYEEAVLPAMTPEEALNTLSNLK